MPVTLAQVLSLTGASVLRWPHAVDVVQPTMRTQMAGTLLFSARPGQVKPAMAQRLADAGVLGVVLFPGEPDPAPSIKLGVLRVNSPPQAFYHLAREHRRRGCSLVVGVTGSSGKSSTKEFLMALLGRRFDALHGTEGSFNRLSDCAELMLALSGSAAEAAVVEMGFAAMGDIDRMAAMARPFAGVITRVTPDHLDGAAGSVETIAREKGRLGAHLPPWGVLALHAEDLGSALIPREPVSARILTFGETPLADVRYTDVAVSEEGTAFTLSLFGQTHRVAVRPFGAAQAANAAAAGLLAHVLGLAPAEVVAGLEATAPLPRRFEIHRFARGLTVIDDTFSNSVDAMTRGLTDAARLAGGRRQVAVLSGIAGLAEQSSEYHRALGVHAVRSGFAELYLVRGDERTTALREGALAAGLDPARIHLVERVAEVAEAVGSAVGPDMLLYCKTSQYLWVGPEIDRVREMAAERGFEPLV